LRQAVLDGRIAGLRPAQRRRLERLSQRRHPADAVADLLTLQRLAAESQALALPLSLVVDGRGLCRLLWVGELEQSGRLLERLPGSQRRQGSDLRLLTCCASRQGDLRPGARESVVGLDLSPRCWLRWAWPSGSGGPWGAELYVAEGEREQPWRRERQAELAELSGLPLELLAGLAPQPGSSSGGVSGLGIEPKHSQTPAARQRGGKAARSGQAAAAERVLLLVLGDGRRDDDRRRVAELEGLVRSAGGEPVGLVEQRRQAVSPQTLWGEGKLKEAALEARRLAAQLVVTDRELTPVQARNLERLLDLPVSDRSELILDIFAQRAASGAGRLQVELAQLRYRLPRLSGRGLSLSRQGGGIGTRGPGETQLEKDRRAIARRLERLQQDVRQLGRHRLRLRQSRQGLPRVALVGYTNAGKSSLLNALTHASREQAVLAADKLFATLDPTTRRLTLLDPNAAQGTASDAAPRAMPVLVTDTVGFIRDLPPQLLEAFRSTIEEALDADLLLLVVDLSDPAWPEQLEAVDAILDELGSSVPRQVIANQIDRCEAAAVEQARRTIQEPLFVSATADLGLRHLRQRLWRMLVSAGAAVAASTTDPLAASAAMVLQLGDTVPDFTQESQLGPINLYSFAGDSWVVLFSHPADYTPVCTTELGEVAKLRAEWEKRNVKTIALSVDSAESHQGWIGDINDTQNTSVDYPILADADRSVSDLYGMIHPNSLNNLTVRSVFIIDPNKKLRLQITYPASTGRNFAEILRVIDSLQLTDNYQVATPVNWKDGDDCVVVPSIATDAAREKFPKGVTEVRPYLRLTPQPNR
jgi:GTP-binding protein HflX